MPRHLISDEHEWIQSVFSKVFHFGGLLACCLSACAAYTSGSTLLALELWAACHFHAHAQQKQSVVFWICLLAPSLDLSSLSAVAVLAEQHEP